MSKDKENKEVIESAVTVAEPQVVQEVKSGCAKACFQYKGKKFNVGDQLSKLDKKDIELLKSKGLC